MRLTVDNFQRAVDTQFERLGIDAVLDPGGDEIPVKLLPTQPDETVRFGSMNILDETGVFEIRVADFAEQSDGVTLQIGTLVRKVQAHQITDRRRLKVRLDTIEVLN